MYLNLNAGAWNFWLNSSLYSSLSTALILERPPTSQEFNQNVNTIKMYDKMKCVLVGYVKTCKV